MSKKYIPALILGLLTLPFLVFLLTNLYVYLFDGWVLNVDKIGVASISALIGIVSTGIATGIASEL